MAKKIYIYMPAKRVGKTADRKTKDAGKFVTKTDIRLPEDPALGRWSGKILPMGSVVYKEGSSYRPWFHHGSARIQIATANLVAETDDSEAKDQEWTEEVEERRYGDLMAKRGGTTTWKGKRVEVVKGEKVPKKTTGSGEMIPEKFLVTFRTVDTKDSLLSDYDSWAKKKGLDPQSRITFKKYVREERITPATEARLEKEANIGQASRDAAFGKLIQTITDGNATVKVFYDEEWEEYVCRLFVNGKDQGDGPVYHTDDKSDAISTARDMARRAKTGDTKDALSDAEKKQLADAEKELDALESKIDRQEDQGVTVMPRDRQRVAELTKLIHQLSTKQTKDAGPTERTIREKERRLADVKKALAGTEKEKAEWVRRGYDTKELDMDISSFKREIQELDRDLERLYLEMRG